VSVGQEVDEVGYPDRPKSKVADALQLRVDRDIEFCVVDHSNSSVVVVGTANRVDTKVEG